MHFTPNQHPVSLLEYHANSTPLFFLSFRGRTQHTRASARRKKRNTTMRKKNSFFQSQEGSHFFDDHLLPWCHLLLLASSPQLSSIIAFAFASLPSPRLHFFCLSQSLSVFKSSCCRRTRIASFLLLLRSSSCLPVRPSSGLEVSLDELPAVLGGAAGSATRGGLPMGRGSHGCSVLGSSSLLLVLLLCVGSAAAQKASTWKTLSGNIHFSSFSFLGSLLSDLIWDVLLRF